MNPTIKDIKLSLNSLNIEKGDYFITKIDRGIEGKNYSICFNSKDNLKYFLKIYSNNNDVKYEVEILNKLSTSIKQIFFPLIEHDIFLIKDKPSVLFKYIKGTALTKNKISISLIKEIANKQALIHLSLTNFRPKSKKVRFSVFDFSFLSFFCKDNTNLYHKKILEEIKIAKKESKLFSGVDFKKTIIHEDLTPENILITRKGINFIDFSESHYAESMSDIAIAIKEIIISNGGVDLSLIKNYLNSYQKIITINKKEVGALFFMIKRRTLFMASYYLGRYEADKSFKKKMTNEFRILNILKDKEFIIRDFISKYNKK